MSHSIRVAPGALAKRRFTGQQFIGELTDAELEKLIQLSRANDKAAAVLERIKLVGMDMNRPRNIAIMDAMRTLGVLTQARKDALVG